MSANQYRTLEWIASADELPTHGLTVLLSFMDPDVVTTGFWDGRSWRSHETGLGIGRDATPTHWARLPHGMEHSREYRTRNTRHNLAEAR